MGKHLGSRALAPFKASDDTLSAMSWETLSQTHPTELFLDSDLSEWCEIINVALNANLGVIMQQ